MKIFPSRKYMFLVMGVGLLVLAARDYINTNGFISKAITVQGTVVELMREGSGYAPVVRYIGEGQQHEIISSVSTDPPSYSIGEEVKIFHAPGNPQDALINGFFQLWGVSLIMASVGAIFSCIGVLSLRASRRKARLNLLIMK